MASYFNKVFESRQAKHSNIHDQTSMKPTLMYEALFEKV